jgi:hypothetical protein
MILRTMSRSHVLVLLVLIGMLSTQSSAQTVNVKFRCNTSTCADTIRPSHIVGLNGESVKGGITGLVWGTGSSTIKLTNVGGDYWETTIKAKPNDTLHYKFITKYDTATMSSINYGWEGDFNNGFDTWTSRVSVIGAKDTVLPVQYYNGGTAKISQYAKPFAAKQDTIAIYFRVNMGGSIFDPTKQAVDVRGGAPLGADPSWITIKTLTREVNSVNSGSMWSGVAYVAKSAITANPTQSFKFVITNPDNWESTNNRTFVISNNLITVGDTTIAWSYFNNKAPSGPKTTGNVVFRLLTGALEKVGLFNRTLGDRIGVTGAKGWVVDPFNFDTDPLMLKMTYNSDLEEWNLISPFTLFPNDQIVYKYYIAWDSTRVDSTKKNFIRGLALSNGWEEPGVTGGADRRYTFVNAAEQTVKGDFGADQQLFNSIHPSGYISAPISVTFSINMAPAAAVATNPTNALFRPGTDTVWISFDGCLVPLTQGKTMYGTDNRLELKDLTGSGIYKGTMTLRAPTLYQLCYRVTYSSSPNAAVTNGGGILMGRRYYQYIRPTKVAADQTVTWPSTFVLPTMDWKVDNLTNENPPNLDLPSGVAQDLNVPLKFTLEQNYPNPFNPSTMITYSVPQKVHVRLDVYNVLGQRITSLVDEEQSAGVHSLMWDAKTNSRRMVSSGVYFLRMEAGSFSQIKKMLLLK